MQSEKDLMKDLIKEIEYFASLYRHYLIVSPLQLSPKPVPPKFVRVIDYPGTPDEREYDAPVVEIEKTVFICVPGVCRGFAFVAFIKRRVGHELVIIPEFIKLSDGKIVELQKILSKWLIEILRRNPRWEVLAGIFEYENKKFGIFDTDDMREIAKILKMHTDRFKVITIPLYEYLDLPDTYYHDELTDVIIEYKGKLWKTPSMYVLQKLGELMLDKIPTPTEPDVKLVPLLVPRPCVVTIEKRRVYENANMWPSSKTFVRTIRVH